ncbi:MAG: phosphoethanolamine--lipid A transferase [Lactobacillales bacterium]|nr:phosphoethanolamine--lipid A transferase [Lactobacillales bacterium]
MKKNLSLSPSLRSIKSIPLIFLLTFYFSSVLNLSFWRFVYEKIPLEDTGNWLFLFSLIIFIAAPLFLFFNLIVCKYIAKPLLAFFLLASSSANYYMFTFGIYIDKDMIRNVFETNTREALDLVTLSGFLWVFLTGVIPALLIVFTKIKYFNLRKEILWRIALVLTISLITGVVSVPTYKEYAAFGRNNQNVRKLLNTINYTYSTFRHFQLQQLRKRQFKILDKNAKIVPDEDNYKTLLVLIIGETARAKNFSLDGYERKTNPLLEKQDIVYFNSTASCGTATAVSLPCMFSHMSRNNFDNNDAAYTENVIDILQKSGYDILWRENDDGCKGVCKRVPIEEMVKINNPKYCNGTYCYDEALLDGLEEKIKNIKTDTVIVLHTMGSHGPTYYKRYPEKFKVFMPTCDTADIQTCTQEEIINTYDNTILYTDHFISSVIDIVKKYPQHEAGVWYVSDHGESLGENNIYLHGLPYGIAPMEQKEVPMLIWMNNIMKKWNYINYDCLKKNAKTNEYSHDNLFHSLLGLLEIKTTEYNKKFDLFKNCRTKPLSHIYEGNK